MTHLPDPLRQLVYQRAAGRCEYCLLHERYTVKRHHVDHIRAEKHGGATDEGNLCLSCPTYNRYKGSDLTSIDPVTEEVTQLFNPRRDNWQTHFHLNGAQIEGLTPQGHTTVRLLR